MTCADRGNLPQPRSESRPVASLINSSVLGAQFNCFAKEDLPTAAGWRAAAP